VSIKVAVILAGGLGMRLRPLTNIIPKPLLPIGESTLLEIQILALRKYGVEKVIIAANYMSDYLASVVGRGEKYGVHVVVSREDQPLGTCGPLTLMREHLHEPFFMMNGDILTDKPNYMQEILAGIYVMQADILSLIPDSTYFGVDSLIKSMLAKRRPVCKYKMHDYWIDIGQLDDYELAKQDFDVRSLKAKTSV
jgi:NDP-sugar pyrophosphorylase family protein